MSQSSGSAQEIPASLHRPLQIVGYVFAGSTAVRNRAISDSFLARFAYQWLRYSFGISCTTYGTTIHCCPDTKCPPPPRRMWWLGKAELIMVTLTSLTRKRAESPVWFTLWDSRYSQVSIWPMATNTDIDAFSISFVCMQHRLHRVQ
jgi:hypothetical protein